MKVTPTESTGTPIRMAAKLINKGHLPVAAHTLNEMTAVAHLYGPWKCNDYGRWREPQSSIIRIPGLSKKAVTQAINSLITRKLIAKWTIDNQDYYELAGAYNFKSLTSAAAKKKVEAAMHPLDVAAESSPIERIEEIRKVVHLKHSTVEVGTPPPYFNDLAGRGKRNKLLLQPPKKVESHMLRMVSPHNVYLGLSPLGCCIRLMLEMVADDLGRSIIDLDDLSSRLGRKIMARSSKQNLREEIERMAAEGHLHVFERGGDTYAYIRDAAQHGMRKMRLTPGLPFLHPEHPEWTLDTAENQLFYARNFAAAARNKMVRTSFEYKDQGGTRFNLVYRPMSFFADELSATIAELSEKAGPDVAVTSDFIRNVSCDTQIKFFMAVEHDLEELALEIYYEDVCSGAYEPPKLTTLDTEAAGGKLLAPALFELRYGSSLIEYVAALEADWLPKWRASPEEPFVLKVFNSAKSVEVNLVRPVHPALDF